MGEPAFLSEEFSNSVDPDLELVTTSGYGKNGAISVLQVIFVIKINAFVLFLTTAYTQLSITIYRSLKNIVC